MARTILSLNQYAPKFISRANPSAMVAPCVPPTRLPSPTSSAVNSASKNPVFSVFIISTLLSSHRPLRLAHQVTEGLGAPRDDFIEQVVDLLGFSRQEPPREVQPGRHLAREIGQVGEGAPRAMIQLLHRAGVDAPHQIGVIQIAKEPHAVFRQEVRGMVQVAQQEAVEVLEPRREGRLLHPRSDLRSEERRVGKEGRSRWSPYH